jgi:diadenosine tetraphosphatase ApaH/serine/threonine PP2A family protein phosphatase
MAVTHAMPGSHRQLLKSLVLSYTNGDYFLVHAGVRAGIALQQQSQQDLLGIREDFLWHEADHGNIIVHGHTPAKQPEVRPSRVHIDTEAYATERLTCVVSEDDRVSFL